MDAPLTQTNLYSTTNFPNAAVRVETRKSNTKCIPCRSTAPSQNTRLISSKRFLRALDSLVHFSSHPQRNHVTRKTRTIYGMCAGPIECTQFHRKPNRTMESKHTSTTESSLTGWKCSCGVRSTVAGCREKYVRPKLVCICIRCHMILVIGVATFGAAGVFRP